MNQFKSHESGNENEAKVIQLCGLNNNRANNTLWNCGVK